MNWLRDFAGSLMQLDLAQLQDFERIGSWPLALRLMVWLLSFLFAMAAGYWLFLQGPVADLERARTKEAELLRSHAALEAGQPEAFRQSEPELNALRARLLQLLPGSSDTPNLIRDLTRLSLAHGLVLEKIQQQPEAAHDFYVEEPMQMNLVGSYHDLGGFVSELAQLPGLVTLHDFSVEPAAAGNGKLMMTVNASSYHHQNTDE